MNSQHTGRLTGHRPAVISIAALLALQVVMALGLASTPSTAAAPEGTISGLVTGSGGTAVEGASVILQAADVGYWRFVKSVDTGTDGRFSFAQVQPDVTYRFVVTAIGYADTYSGSAGNPADAKIYQLTPGQQLDVGTVKLVKEVTISGRVTNAAGVGVGARVEVYDANSTSTSSRATASTAADGSYVVEGLPAGRWKLEVIPDDGAKYLPEYYRDATGPSTATVVDTTPGANVAGVNMTLDPAARIQGKVTGPNGPVGDTIVRACLVGEKFCDRDVRSAATGSFTVAGLRAGDYQVYFLPPAESGLMREFYRDAATVETATSVTVPAGGTVTLNDAVLDLGASVSGRVTAADGSGIKDIEVHVYRKGEDYQNTAYQATTDATGAYVVKAIPSGSYVVRFEPRYSDTNPSPFLTEWWRDAAEPTQATAIDLTAGQPLTGIDASLALGGAISGRVIDEAGAPISGATVQVGAAGKRTRTDAAGNYVLSGLPAGSHLLQFDASGYVREYFDDAIELSAATPLEVSPGVTLTAKNAVLARGATLGGTVKDTANRAVAGVNVTVYRRLANATWGSWGSSTTDASGVWSNGSLPAGTYRLGYTTNANLIEEFYDDAPTLTQATDIVLADKQSRTDLHAVLAPGTTISGTLTRPSGAPAESVSVVAYAPSQGGWSAARTAMSNVLGAYVLRGLRPGVTYRVCFAEGEGGAYAYDAEYLAECYQDAETPQAAGDLTPPAAGLTGIDAQLQLGSSIGGSVKMTDGGSVPDLEVSAYVTKDGQWVRARSSYVVSDIETTYEIPKLRPGTYRVCVTTLDEVVVTCWRDSATLDSATDVAVGAASQVTDIVLTVDRAKIPLEPQPPVDPTPKPPVTPGPVGPVAQTPPVQQPVVPPAVQQPVVPPVVAPPAAPTPPKATPPVPPSGDSGAAITVSLSGKGKVGKALKVGKLTLPAGSKVSYQWLRNGKPIKKAASGAYKLTAKDRGKVISVRVTITTPGQPPIIKVVALPKKVK